MRYLLPFIILALAAPGLLAQGSDEIDIPTDSRYLEIYNKYERTLESLGYPVGRARNAAYVPDQYVFFYEGPTAAQDAANDRARLENRLGANRVHGVATCGCGDYQISVLQLDSLGGEERGKRGRESVAQDLGKEEVEPNYYIVPELNQVEKHPGFNRLPRGFTVKPSGKRTTPVDIAVIDSGIDVAMQDSRYTAGGPPLYLWENPSPNSATDPFCFPNDFVGWDFVNNDNSPMDDHSHGTHVASRIAMQLDKYAPDVNYRFMPLKILDQNGVGTSFHAACAVFYAAYHGADVINASWGMYGERDRILTKAFRYAQSQGVATVSSAGNERVDLAELEHYPSGFPIMDQLPIHSMLFISASRGGSSLWPGTNIRLEPTVPGNFGGFVAAPGDNQYGYIPRHLSSSVSARKSGTSVATPYATAIAAEYRHRYPTRNPIWLRNDVLAAIKDQGNEFFINQNGQAYPYYIFDWVNVP
ncbi:S8 family serine peptidase [Lewinella sp. W8]|uniref:S8 family serine peptidase n=1 Tax=Lewinella sp. W8 TaxID=2528208 RepID=UPI001068C57F|nr:S8 family serine peptidase [Lewinella sp. W8]MTB53742.1 S8 family serine peptidase [Lewinella sp. W8]